MGFLHKLAEKFKGCRTYTCRKCGGTEGVRIVSTDPQSNLIRFRCLHCGYEWIEL